MKGIIQTKQQYPKNIINYFKKEGLEKYFEVSIKHLEYDPMFNVSQHNRIFPAEMGDLVRLHKLIRIRKVFTVLEFGSGYSTIIIADALKKNKMDFDDLKIKPKIRKQNMFKVYSVETSEKWKNKTLKLIPKQLLVHVKISHTNTTIGTFNGRICHYYDKLPNITPDFIYLDGPDSTTTKGEIRGINFNSIERTPMSGDILSMESILMPGTFILVDGRTNNARFLESNLQRDWKYIRNYKDDFHTFELIESPLGVYNEAQLQYCLGRKDLR